MKLLWWIRWSTLSALVVAAPLASCGVIEDDKTLQELNVNSRYTVESVQILSLHHDGLPQGRLYKERTSSALRADLDKIVGQKLDHSALERLAARIKQELFVSDVAIKISRGVEPEHVIVDFEVTRSREQDFDLNVAKFLYDSREGWTGEGSATTNFKGNALTFDVLSDSNTLIERYSGIRARFERKDLGWDRLTLRFEFDSYHDQWNPATLAAAPPSMMIYRNRDAFTPEATVAIAPPVDLDLGVSFARFRPSFPEEGPDEAGLAAKTESSNAVVSTLRYHRRWGSEHDQREQSLNGSYSFRTATNLLGTDQNYTRHFARLNYVFRHARSFLETTFLAGRLTGRAPLFERFELGDSTTLRGWSKFDLDPLGGSRVLHGSIDYRYRFFQLFYDRGAIWDRAQDRDAKQSIGTGFKVERFQLAVAFPIRGGHAGPILYAGMNF
jgi:surface antigen Omp85-like protein